MMRKILFIIVLGLLSASQASAQPSLLLNGKVRHGKLPNGMSYYIMANRHPEKVASYYMVGNIGALLEKDKQRGLAHFLEHMAFNGTRHFPGQAMKEFVERQGVVAGQGLNAHTGQNATVYKLSNIPADRSEVVDTCLLLLYDWMCGITFDVQKIGKERQVIQEEMRTRRDLDFRLMKKIQPVVAQGSQYAKRDVIGDPAVIKKADAGMLREFYHSWYRPDLLAVVVVGDVDVQQMERKVRELFGRIPEAKGAEDRPFFTIPAHEEMYYVLATDRELKNSTVSLRTVLEGRKPEAKDATYLREMLVRMLYNAMFSGRVASFNQEKNTLIYGANSHIMPYERGYDIYQMDVMSDASQEAAALELIYRENERVRRFGFTDGELAKAGRLLLDNFETVVQHKDKIGHDELAGGLQQYFLEKNPMPDIEDYYRFVKEVVPEITPEEILQYARKWMDKKNRTLVVTGPTEQIHISKSKALAVMKKVEEMELEPWEEQPVQDISLLTEKPVPGKIIKVKENSRFRTEEWTLSNGAKVIFAPDHTSTKVILTAYSKGGTSLCGVSRLPSAEVLNEFVKVYGVGDMDAAALMQYMKDHQVTSEVNLGALSETVTGTAPADKLEAMFQLMYMRFEKPRFDMYLHNALLERKMAEALNAQASVQQQIMDSLMLIMNNYHPRVMIRNKEFWNRVSIDSLAQTYVERIVDASDFIFFISGKTDKEKIKPLVETYLGSLRTFNRHEVARDNHVRAPKGKTIRDIRVNFGTPRAMTWLSWSKEMSYSRENEIYLKVVQFLLRQRCTQMVREKSGGAYGVNVELATQKEPFESCKGIINFECDPTRVAEIKQLIYNEVDAICRQEISQQELNKIIEIIGNTYEQEVGKLSRLEILFGWYIEQTDVSDVDAVKQILSRMTSAGLLEFTGRLFRDMDLVDITFSN